MKFEKNISPKMSLEGWYFGGDEYSSLSDIIEKVAQQCAIETLKNVFDDVPMWNPLIVENAEDGPCLRLEWHFDDSKQYASVELPFSTLAAYLDHKDRPSLSSALRNMADHIDAMHPDK